MMRGSIHPRGLIPFSLYIAAMALLTNKDMGGGKLYLSSMGLIQLEFELENIFSKYFIVRKAETEF